MYTRPRHDEVRSSSATYADNPSILRIAYSKSARPGEVMTLQKKYATVTIAPTGGTSSELLITLKEYTADQSGTAAATVTHSINGNTYDTLKKIVDYINELEGFTAWVTDAPYSHDTGSDAFVALAETTIPESPEYLDCLKRSVATSNPIYKRIGEPTERDSGYIKVLSVITSVTSGTAGNLKIERDNGVDAVKTLDEAAATSTAKTAYFSAKIDEAPTYQGPLLVTFSATSLAGGTLTVRHQQAND
jgi:hypothetical protein